MPDYIPVVQLNFHLKFLYAGLCCYQVRPRLKELQLFTLQHESSEADQQEIITKKSVRENRKSTTDINSENSPAKRRKETPRKSTDGKDRNTVDKGVHSDDFLEKKPVEGVDVKEQELKDSSDDKSKGYTDQCTAFISNLDVKACGSHLLSVSRVRNFN